MTSISHPPCPVVFGEDPLTAAQVALPCGALIENRTKDRIVAPSSIITAHNFSTIIDIVSALGSDACVLWDVDLTLIVPDDDEFWVKFEIESEEVAPHYAAFAQWLKQCYGDHTGAFLFNRAFFLRRRSLTNDILPDLLNQLARQHVSVMRLTAIFAGEEVDGTEYADRRFQIEKTLGLNFEQLFANQKDMPFPIRDNEEGLPVRPKAINGEIFCAKLPKGEVLDEYWQVVKPPSEVVCIDNDLSNLESVQAACRKYNIKFTGIHYTEIAERFPGDFDEELAKYKFSFLAARDIWLPDSLAKRYMSEPGDQKNQCHCVLL